jgi:hypothetical protein
MKTILRVTKADRDLARLHLELADRLGEPRDPRMEIIAQAHPQGDRGSDDDDAAAAAR